MEVDVLQPIVEHDLHIACVRRPHTEAHTCGARHRAQTVCSAFHTGIDLLQRNQRAHHSRAATTNRIPAMLHLFTTFYLAPRERMKRRRSCCAAEARCAYIGRSSFAMKRHSNSPKPWRFCASCRFGAPMRNTLATAVISCLHHDGHRRDGLNRLGNRSGEPSCAAIHPRFSQPLSSVCWPPQPGRAMTTRPRRRKGISRSNAQSRNTRVPPSPRPRRPRRPHRRRRTHRAPRTRLAR